MARKHTMITVTRANLLFAPRRAQFTPTTLPVSRVVEISPSDLHQGVDPDVDRVKSLLTLRAPRAFYYCIETPAEIARLIEGAPPVTAAPPTGVLWWVAQDEKEVAAFRAEIAEAGGKILDVTGAGDVLFQVDRAVAVEKGWAEGVNSDEWMVEENGHHKHPKSGTVAPKSAYRKA